MAVDVDEARDGVVRPGLGDVEDEDGRRVVREGGGADAILAGADLLVEGHELGGDAGGHRRPRLEGVRAVAVQVGTAIFADPTLPVRLIDELAVECGRRGLDSHRPLIGTALPRKQAPSSAKGAEYRP